jgi:glycosyltransferase involved in cell wall biosynthesis
MENKFDLSLIIPCYNEGEIFEQNVKKVFSVLEQTDFSYEVIFVEDCSTDKTLAKIKKIIKANPRFNLGVIYHQKNLGRGRAVADGFLEARGKIVGFIDIDLEVPADYIPRFVNAINEGNDLAIANRVYDLKLRNLTRWIASKGYIFLRDLLLKTDFQDTEAGYKFFNRQKILPVLKKTKDSGWFWDTEIMVRSKKANLKIIEIPTVFIKNFEKKSTVNLIPDSIEYFIKLVKFNKEFKKRK